MDDLISRQEAVKEARELFELGGCYCDRPSIVGMLNSLPSAQPETEERIPESEQNVPNDELISKKAAIDAVNRALDRETLLNKFVRQVAVDAIMAVPSAQSEIIRCKDCEHGSPNGKYGCRVYHYRRYETHDMEPDDFCSRAERRPNHDSD